MAGHYSPYSSPIKDTGGTSRISYDTNGVAFNGATPAARPDYTTTNGSTDRTFDANATSVDELADIVHTVISDLISMGLLQ